MLSRALRRASSALVLLAACGEAPVEGVPDGGRGGQAPDAGVSTADAGSVDAGPPEDPTARMFDRARLMRVEVELDPADWDALRRQSRFLPDLLGDPMCLAEPFTSPYTWFPAQVTIDGQTVAQVGVRKKGFIGSLSETRPSLKLSIDEYVEGQRFSGMERITLNNGRQDPSRVRTCLAYDVFRAAGLPAPRCSFARVRVNGEELGVYVHVEAVKKDFLRRHFDDDEGLLYEGTLSDFRAGWTGTFEKKTNEDEPDDRAALDAVVRALEVPDERLLESLESVIDVDAFFTFWATEVLVAHWDGYAGNLNNFFVYRDPLTERFYFLPWGTDGVFARSPFLGAGAPESVYAMGQLARRLYLLPAGRARYLERLDRLLAEVWSEAELGAELQRLRALLGPAVLDRRGFDTAIVELERYLNGRRGALRADLAVGGADWTLPERGDPCFAVVGTLTATLATTWGTHPTNNVFQTGRGGLYGQVDTTSFRATPVGGSAGWGVNPDDRDRAVLIVAGILPDGAVGVIYVAADPALLVPGAVLPIDDTRVRTLLLRAPAPGQPLQIAAWLRGELRITRLATTPGAPVEAEVRAELLQGR
jgi:hypothetical protein